MGDPKKNRATYSGPRHPWERARIDEEKELLRDYGLKNKKEIWKESSFIKKIKKQVVALNSVVGEAADQQKEELILKLKELKLIDETQTLDDALNLTIKDVMERRLQTQLVRVGLARSMKQARQFIVHGHVMVNGKKITSPSYMVSRTQGTLIEFIQNSTLHDPEHPERKVVEKEKVVEEREPIDESSLEEEIAKEVFEKITEDA